MFNKRFSFGRAALLAALVLFLSVGFISCQREAEYPGYVQVGNVKAYDLKADDPICGEWEGTWGLLLYSSPDFVWATAASGTVLTDTTGKESNSYVSIEGYYGTENYNKDSDTIYVVYNSNDGVVNKNEGVLLFVAKTSTGYPRKGSWYGVKFKINADDSTKALIEGAYNGDDVESDPSTYQVTGYKNETGYNTVSSLEEAVEKFSFANTECFSEYNWTESASGATKK